MKKILKKLLGLIFKKAIKNMTPKFQIGNLDDDSQEQPKVLNKEDEFGKEKGSEEEKTVEITDLPQYERELEKGSEEDKSVEITDLPQYKRKLEKGSEEDKPVEITDLSQYKRELEKGTTNFDFSKLNLIGEDIQGVNLENLGLNINLREIFVPYNGAVKIGNNILSAVFNLYSRDYYLRLEQAKLGGNNVIGDLTYFEGNKCCSPVYIWYSEETFDEKYKSQYPQFFLSEDAPEELREKYYNPRIAVEKVCDIVAVINDLEDKYIERKILERHTLTLDDYLKYYKFLKGKYLGNFSITDEDLMVIKIIEKYGLEKKNEIFEELDKIRAMVEEIADLEEIYIEELSDKGACLVLELKFKNKEGKRENKQ